MAAPMGHSVQQAMGMLQAGEERIWGSCRCTLTHMQVAWRLSNTCCRQRPLRDSKATAGNGCV